MESEQEDVWSSLLNPKVLDKLTEYIPLFPEDVKIILNNAVAKRMSNDTMQSVDKKSSNPYAIMLGRQVHNDQPNIAEHQEQELKDKHQKDLYKMFMMHSQPLAEQQAKKFQTEMKE